MIALTDVVRHVRALEAADDAEFVMNAAEVAFADMTDLVRTGKHELARNAAAIVGDLCLRLCACPSTTARAADDKRRFLAIMSRWAWPRAPALGAVLEAARQAEQAWDRD